MNVSSRAEFLSAYALAGMIPILLFLPPLLGGQSSFLLQPDALEQTYAWYQKLADAWNNGYLLLWDANVYSGHSLAGEIQASVFYPLTWLWLMLFAEPEGMPRLAIECLILLHFLLAAFTMLALLRHWGIKPLPALAGALCFSLIGPVAERASAQPNIFFGLCWLPLAVYLASLHLETKRLSYAILAGAVIALQVLSGHIQPAFHTSVVVGVMCCYWHYTRQPHWAGRLKAAAISGGAMVSMIVLLALPQWILTLQYLSDAYRWLGEGAPIGPGDRVPFEIFSRQFIISPVEYLSLVDPWRIRLPDQNHLYLGPLGLLLACWVMNSRQRRAAISPLSIHAPWLLGIAIFAVIVTWGYLTPLSYLLNRLPLAGQVRQLGRYAIIIQFSACIFAAAGVQLLLERLPVARLSWRAITAWGLGMVFVLYFFRFGVLSWQASFSWGLALLLLGIAAMPLPFTRRLWLVSALLATVCYPIWQIRPWILPRHNAGNMMPEDAFAALPILREVEAEYGLARIIIDGDTGLPKNYADVHDLQSRTGHSATMYRPYFDFMSLNWDLDSEVSDALNMRYRLSASQLDLPVVAHDPGRGITLYRRPSAYPRVFLGSRVRKGTPASRQPDHFAMLRYDDHTVHFSFSLEQADTVIISEMDYPGWCAELDGRPVKIDRARLAGFQTPFRAVDATVGNHELVMKYRPFAYLFGACRA